ncbi:MAG: NADH-quinone oxidoreductase subunit H [Proteobacteria bacterium]|nr:NADH-quinone oxidoreductase subunit H [Pseudomonadota bacterium]
MTGLILQIVQSLSVLLVAPLFTGLVRKIKARLVGRVGPALVQPYRDLARLMRKEAVVAEHASWLFRSTPYVVFALAWLVASVVPTFAIGHALAGVGDLIAIVALLATARFFLALAGMDIGTSFGGIGASRDLMIASLAEPAMLMVVFSVALVAGSTALPTIASFVLTDGIGLEVSLALALISVVMVAIAENGRIPIDNPATHLELTMVHEAMVLEYSGRHLALIEAAGMLRLVIYVSLIACIFAPWGLARAEGAGLADYAVGYAVFVLHLGFAGLALAVFETSIAKMRVFRVGEFLGAALILALLAVIFRFVSDVF